MKKIGYLILCVFILFFATGCNVDYDLVVKDKIEENITISLDKEECVEGEIKPDEVSCKEMLSEIIDGVAEDTKPVSHSIKDTSNGAVIKFKYSYDSIADFNESDNYKQLFSNRKIDGNSYKYKKLKNVQGDDLKTNYNIKLESDKFIIDSNSTSSDILKGIYKWNYTNDSKGSNVEFSISDNDNFIKKYPVLFFVGALVVLVMLILLPVFIVKSRKAKKDI